MSAMNKPGTKSVSLLLAENQELAGISARLAMIARLQKLFAATIPAHLNTASRIATLEGATLIVATANGPTAMLLKQMLPRLLAKIQETQADEVTAIRILVQPEYFAIEVPPRPPKSGELVSVQALSVLSAQLSDSPLKETVEKIKKKRERALTK